MTPLVETFETLDMRREKCSILNSILKKFDMTRHNASMWGLGSATARRRFLRRLSLKNRKQSVLKTISSCSVVQTWPLDGRAPFACPANIGRQWSDDGG